MTDQNINNSQRWTKQALEEWERKVDQEIQEYLASAPYLPEPTDGRGYINDAGVYVEPTI